MSIGNVYIALVSSEFTQFNSEGHAREDLTVFELHFSQIRGEAGIVTISCLYPAGGMISLDRFAIISAEIDGVVTELARGEIVRFPFGLEGDTISLEVMCRGQSHIADVDALYSVTDALIPTEMERSDRARRSEAYILDDVYHDPISLIPSFSPIAGDSPPVREFYAEGGAAGTSNVLSIRSQYVSTPARTVTARVSVDFTQKEYGSVNLAGSLSVSQVKTFTPRAMQSALSSISLNGGYSMLSASLESEATGEAVYAWITEPVLDEWTCIKIFPAYRGWFEHRIKSLDVRAEVVIDQDRSETLEIVVTPGIVDIGGSEDVIEEIQATNVEALCPHDYVVSYSPNPDSTHLTSQFIRTGVADSVFMNDGVLRSSTLKIVDAAIARASRIAVERAHCIEITIEVPAADCLGLTLKDRVKVFDQRLPAGVATGKIVGLEWIIAAKGSVGKIILSCPASSSVNTDSVSVSTARGLATAPDVYNPPLIHSLRRRSNFDFTQNISVNNESDKQLVAMGLDLSDLELDPEMQPPPPESGINPYPLAGLHAPLNDPPTTTLTIDLRDLSQVDPDDLPATKLQHVGVSITLPEGISL